MKSWTKRPCDSGLYASINFNNNILEKLIETVFSKNFFVFLLRRKGFFLEIGHIGYPSKTRRFYANPENVNMH